MDWNAKAFEAVGEREIRLDSKHPSRILHHILEEVPNSKDYLYLITGKIGIPTGKTWLYNSLKTHGYNAIELTEDLCDYVIYRYPSNRYYVNPRKKLIIVVLNEHWSLED